MRGKHDVKTAQERVQLNNVRAELAARAAHVVVLPVLEEDTAEITCEIKFNVDGFIHLY